MASTFINDLRLEEMATGENAGSWGTKTNTNLELIAEAFSFSTEGITTNADTHTTTIADGATDPGRSMYLKYTGALDSTCTITIGPNTVSKLWFIENGTSGSQDIIIKQGSGTTVTISPGDTKAIYSDGAGSGGGMVDAFASLSVGALTATTADNTAQLTLISTDADANAGPKLKLRRNSASPADDDLIGALDWTSENSDGDEHDFLNLTARMRDVTAGNEDVAYAWTAYLGGTGREVQSFVNTAASAASMVFNEDSQDIDFRVESNNLANALFVDAAEDKVFIGHGTTHQYDAFGAEIIMQIEAAGTEPYAGIGMVQNSNDSDVGPLIFGKSRGTSLGSTTIVQDDDLLGRIEFQGMDGSDLETGASIFAAVDGTPGADDMPGRLVFNTTADGANSASERMRISSGGVVGVNGSGYTNGKFSVLAGAVNSEIASFSGSAHGGGLKIKTASTTRNDDTVIFNASDAFGEIAFASDNTEVMRITKDNNLVVGTTNANPTGADVVGASIDASGEGNFSVDGAEALRLNRKSSDGEILNLRKDGSTVGSISTWSSNMAVGRINCALLFDDDTNRIKPASVQSNTTRDNVIDLGDPSHRFNDVWIGGGIHLGGTGSDNKLDDYEEGTFTPTFGDGNGTHQAITGAAGRYTKIGQRVFVEATFVRNNTTGTDGNLRMGSLPFTSSSNSSATYITGHMWIDNGGPSTGAGDEVGAAYLGGGSTSALGVKSTTSAQQANIRYFQYSQVTNGRPVSMSIVYRTDS